MQLLTLLALSPNQTNKEMVSTSLKRKRHRFTAPQQEQRNSKNNKQIPSLPQQTDIFQTTKLFLHRFALGLVGAFHACAILTLLMFVSVLVGFGIVTMWVEEPVVVDEKIYFDYVQANPVALLRFWEDGLEMDTIKGLPVGHSFSVWLVLLLPESDFNCDIGVFQVVAELISANGNVIARTSQPCMLKFSSLIVQQMRRFLMAVPLIMGLKSESQRITIAILKHKERAYPRTEAIKVTLIPRSGTNFIPHIYESKIILNSKLPWRKEIVRRWKWTFCIWTSLYVYTLLVVVLLCWFRHVIFKSTFEVERYEELEKVEERKGVEERENREVSEMLRRWRRRRNQRKAIASNIGSITETMVPSSGSSMSITWEESLSDSVEFAAEDSETVGF